MLIDSDTEFWLRGNGKEEVEGNMKRGSMRANDCKKKETIGRMSMN